MRPCTCHPFCRASDLKLSTILRNRMKEKSAYSLSSCMSLAERGTCAHDARFQPTLRERHSQRSLHCINKTPALPARGMMASLAAQMSKPSATGGT